MPNCPGYFNPFSSSSSSLDTLLNTAYSASDEDEVLEPKSTSRECLFQSVARYLQQLISRTLSSATDLLQSITENFDSSMNTPPTVGPFVRFGSLQRTVVDGVSSDSSEWLWIGSMLVLMKGQTESPLLLIKIGTVQPTYAVDEPQTKRDAEVPLILQDPSVQLFTGVKLDSVRDEMYAWRFDLQIPLVHGCQQTVRYVVLPTIDPSTGREFVLSAGPRERWLQCLQNSNGDSSSKSLRIPLTALNANIDGSLLIQQLNDNPSVNRFYLPAANTSMHWLFGSCNGQSQTDEGMSYSKPSDPGINRAVGWKHRMLCDIRRKHESEQPFHLMVGAGDQIYLDGLFHRENCPSVADWLEQMRKIGFTDDSTEQTKGITNSISERTRFIHDQSAVTPEMLAELERFIFTSYCNHFMEADFAYLLASIPQTMIWDDHDIFDGYGSYPANIRLAPVIQTIYSVARRFYLLFQLHTTQTRLLSPPTKGAAEFISNGKSVNFLKLIGPSTAILGVDTRSERTINHCTSNESWQLITSRLQTALAPSVRHLIIIQTVPVIWPDLKFAEKAANWLSRWQKRLCLPQIPLLQRNHLYNTLFYPFAEQFLLLDDMMDRWTSERHVDERRWMIGWLQRFSAERSIRVAFISGDPHAAGVGRFRSRTDQLALTSCTAIKPTSSTHQFSINSRQIRRAVRKSFTNDIKVPRSVMKQLDRQLVDSTDCRLMYSVTSSALVNDPPPQILVKALHISDALGTTNSRNHRINGETAEEMMPVFEIDADGKTKRGWMGRKVMNRRNWCQVKPDDFVEAVQAHKWQFILHVEADYQQDQTELRTAQYPISVLPLLNSSERELLFLAGNKEKSL